MSVRTIAALGVVAVGGFLLWHHTAKADEPKRSNLPTGWTPPSGATFTTVSAAQSPTGFQIDRWNWDQQSPGAPGVMVLAVNHANPQTDFVAGFIPADRTQQRGILAMGSTQNSQLMAQAFVGGE